MKLKPILIPTGKQSIEVGDLTLPNYPNKINEGELGIAVRSFERNDAYKSYDIILIDTEAEIIEGDIFYNTFNGIIGMSKLKKWGKDDISFKIISSTDKSYKIPYLTSFGDQQKINGVGQVRPITQLSPQSIQILINYYNEHGEMPKRVNIETMIIDNIDQLGVPIDWDEVEYRDYLALNQQGEVDITISKVEKSTQNWYNDMNKNFKEGSTNIKEKLYTEKEVFELMRQCAINFKAIGGNEQNNCWLSHHNDMYLTWLNSNKKK